MDFETLKVRKEGAVLFAEISAPPMNLLGPELVRDLVSLIQEAEADNAVRVLVFKSADPDYFISHVDVTRIGEYREATAKLTGEASLGLLFRYLSASHLVTITQVEGRVRGAGSEFVLACDMIFARELAVFSQPETGFGLIPGAGGIQHLSRLMGRGRTLEVMLSAEDYDAEFAEKMAGSIGRCPLWRSATSSDRSRIASRVFRPAAWSRSRSGSTRLRWRQPRSSAATSTFLKRARSPEALSWIKDAAARGFQTRDGELDLARMIGELD